MNFNIDRFTFFASYWAAIKRMNPAQQHRILIAIMEYMFESREPEFEDDILLASVFDALKPNLDRSLNNSKTGALGQEAKGALNKKNKGPSEGALNKKNKGPSEGALNKKNKGPSEGVQRGLPAEIEKEKERESKKKEKTGVETESARAIATPNTSIEFPDMGGREEYGFYNNVYLTPREFAELQRRYPHDFQKMIENLSAYMRRKGKTYADHFETMIQWKEEDDRKANEQDMKQDDRMGWEDEFLKEPDRPSPFDVLFNKGAG